jgi:hypothetical protein
VGSVVSGFCALYTATRKEVYAVEARRWAGWFFGGNEASAAMYDIASGRCYDGLDRIDTPAGRLCSVSANAGAESAVEALLALQALERISP